MMSKNSISKCYLHLGAHRTGTSVIQRTIEQNRDAWSMKFDTSFILGGDPICKQIKRYWYYQQPEQEELPSSIQFENLSGHSTVVLSDENLLGGAHMVSQSSMYMQGLNKIRILQDIFKAANQTVIFYIREYADWLESLYMKYFNWSIRQGCKPDRFKEFFSGMNLALSEFSWAPFINGLRERVGDARLEVIRYEDAIVHPAGLLGNFFEICDLPQDSTVVDNTIKRVNISGNALYYHICSLMMPALLRIPVQQRLWFVQLIRGKSVLLGKGKPRLFDENRRKVLADRYESETAYLISL